MSANTSFQIVNEQGWRRGFANLLRHENAEWWRSRWWINSLIWLALINGILLAMLSNTSEGVAPQQVLDEARTIYTVIAGLFGSIGAVIAVQGVIIHEKKSATAAWIMSKPASRPAFILAKLVANIVELLIIVV